MRLAMHNLKKSKGQYISFGVMLLITALIMNIALVLAFQTQDAYDDYFESLDTADVNVLIPKLQDYDGLADKIAKVDGILEVEEHEGVFVSATVRDFADSDFDMNTVFYNADSERSLNRLEVSECTGMTDKAVQVPMYMTALGGFSAGEDITYSIDGTDYTFTIDGVVSEMQYGNYGTGLIGAYLPKEAYDDFAKDHEAGLVMEYSMKVTDGADLTDVKNDITKLLSDEGIAMLKINDRDTSKQARTMVCNLLIVIFIALAAIILIVSIFLSNFRIRNTIEEEMTDMGVLKALGYTSSMIIRSSVIPYTLVGGISALIGTIISIFLIPSVASILAVQSGFSFTPDLDIMAALLTILIPTIVILAFAYISAKKIRILQPINAIRGITGTGVDKNHFPLESTKTGIGFTLILKQIASSAGQNVLLFAVSFGITVLLAFAGTLFYNVNIKPDNFMDTLSEETPAVIFTAKEGKLEELKTKLENDTDVELVLEYATVQASYADGSLTTFVCEDFSLVTNDICYEGKNPVADNEIAIGSALSDKYDIGSEIELTVGDNSAMYTVTGYVQSINNTGEVCELSKKGYERISENLLSTLNVYADHVTVEDFIDKWETDYPELITDTLNYKKLAENGQKMYSGIVSAVTIVLFIISVLVVLLVMYIIINSMLTRRRQEFGIYKAIGYSSRQLVTQSALGFVPVIGLASVISAVMGLMYMPAIDNVIFGMLGAMKNHFEVPLWFLLIFSLLFTFASFIISVLLAAPIKKITAYSLLKE
ncbi:MAG: ABC transporter permease [Clostridium sp.]|nr:ABC transporter permease [Clostridium sp.]MCM1208118.1 ABC transporter permease [Ruminococcus sp.]